MSNPFHPRNTGTSTITVGTSSSATALPVPNCERFELQNNGSVPVFVAFGDSGGITVTVATGYPVLPGHSKVVRWRGATHIATISGTAAQTLYVSAGDGN